MARILIIDDDCDVRATISRTLKRAEHDVFEAADGNEGIKMFRNHRPELVITDIFMPAKEGLETIQELRAEFPEIRVLAISGGGAGAGNEFLRMSGLLGAQATLAKPFRAAELLAVVNGLLAQVSEVK